MTYQPAEAHKLLVEILAALSGAPESDDTRALRAKLERFASKPPSDFDAPDANFGVYVSRDLFGYRLKLDVKPILVPQPEAAPEHRLQLLFNYHADLPQGGEAADAITALLQRWREASEESRRMVGTIHDGDGV